MRRALAAAAATTLALLTVTEPRREPFAPWCAESIAEANRLIAEGASPAVAAVRDRWAAWCAQ